MKTTLKVQPFSNLTIPWAEFISKEGSTQGYSLSMNESTATIKILVNYTDIRDACNQILGYSKSQGGLGAVQSMSRQLPMRHPYFNWLYAQRVTDIAPCSWLAKQGYIFGPLSTYEFAVITIQFWSPPFEILADGVPEYTRFVIRQFQPTVEVLTLDQGGFVFTTNAAGPAPVAGGAQAKVPTGLIITKMRILLKWLQVSDDFLFNAGGSNNGGLPTGILNGVGMVNNAAFMNYPANTLLLETPQFESVVQPVNPLIILPPAAVNLNSVPRAWNVTVPLLYFAPPIKAGQTQFGHLSAPSSDGNWWKIQTQSGGNPIYGNYDFTKIFKPAT